MAKASRSNSLTVEIIVKAAVQAIQKEGLGGLSMRQLASTLGVTPTAIYHHITDKDELIDLCAEQILAQIAAPDPQRPWHERLRALILNQQRAFARYPGLARYLLLHRESSAAALLWAESILAVLRAAGYGGQAAMGVLISMSFLINPITLVDDRAPSRKTNTVLNRTRVASLIKQHPGRFPSLVEVLPYIDGNTYESRFEIALDRVIVGIRSELEQVPA